MLSSHVPKNVESKCEDATCIIEDLEAKIKHYENNIMYLPVKNPIVTSGYGWRKHPIHKQTRFHEGVDLKSTTTDTVYAVNDGEIRSYTSKGLGKYVKLVCGSEEFTYGHLSKILVEGTVAKGQAIAIMGSTGSSTGKHLHFEHIKNDTLLNPSMNQYLNHE